MHTVRAYDYPRFDGFPSTQASRCSPYPCGSHQIKAPTYLRYISKYVLIQVRIWFSREKNCDDSTKTWPRSLVRRACQVCFLKKLVFACWSPVGKTGDIKVLVLTAAGAHAPVLWEFGHWHPHEEQGWYSTHLWRAPPLLSLTDVLEQDRPCATTSSTMLKRLHQVPNVLIYLGTYCTG